MSGKRLFDLCIAVPLFIVTLPVQIAIAFGILLTMGRPVFFLQERPGLHGKPFTIIKFRTMRPQGSRTAHETARITQFGSWLRRSSLDELPELINVLKGDMSVVGPRPLLLEYLPLYSNRQARRHIVKPGLTGMAQVSGRNQLTWEEKFEHDLWYADHQSLSLDLKIILKTIPAFFIWRNIDQSNAETMEPFRGNDACSNGGGPPAP